MKTFPFFIEIKITAIEFNERDVKRARSERGNSNRCVGAAAIATRNEKSCSTLHLNMSKKKKSRPERGGNVSCLRTIVCCNLELNKNCLFFWRMRKLLQVEAEELCKPLRVTQQLFFRQPWSWFIAGQQRACSALIFRSKNAIITNDCSALQLIYEAQQLLASIQQTH